MSAANEFSLPPLVERVRAVLPDQEIYLVGGAVRDALLGMMSHDLDFSVPENAIPLARRVANALQADFYVLDEGFDAARVIVRSAADNGEGFAETRAAKASGDILDFSAFRMPGSARASRLEADLRGRDFTINAMAYDVRVGTIQDPLHGAADLRGKVLRACSGEAMQEDAIRILRGVRLAEALEFRIEQGTIDAMKAAVRRLPTISPERQRDELFKILEGRRPDACLRVLETLGVFPHMLPELSAMNGVQQSAPHVAEVWNHTLSVMQYLEGVLAALIPDLQADRTNDLFTSLLSLKLGRYREKLAEHFAAALNPGRPLRALLFFAALYHDVAKPGTRTVEETGRIRFLGHDAAGAEVAAQRGRAFNLSKDEIGRVQKIIANHMRFHFHVSRWEGEKKQPTRRSIYRFFRDTGEAGVDLMLLGLADLRGTRGHLLTQETWSCALDVARIFLENYWEKPEEAVAPPRLLNGDEVMRELHLEAGPMLGELLAAIREAQATGEVSDRSAALAYGRNWLSKRG